MSGLRIKLLIKTMENTFSLNAFVYCIALLLEVGGSLEVKVPTRTGTGLKLVRPIPSKSSHPKI